MLRPPLPCAGVPKRRTLTKGTKINPRDSTGPAAGQLSRLTCQRKTRVMKEKKMTGPGTMASLQAGAQSEEGRMGTCNDVGTQRVRQGQSLICLRTR